MIGIALYVYALALHPLIALVAGRPLQAAEVVGIAPDPTASATLGLLSLGAQQRHKIIQKGVALVGEESVSGVMAEPPPGQSGAPTHAHLHYRQRRDHAVPQGAGDSQ